MMHHYFHKYIPSGREWLADQIEQTQRLLFGTDPIVTTLHEGEPGFEMVTLKRMQEDLQALPDTDLILYTHTKGISRPDGEEFEFTSHWRHAMELYLTWVLRSGYEPQTAIGAFLLESSYFKNKVDGFGDYDFFGGNFWLANVGFLKTLPPIELDSDRFFAERWIGMTGAKLESHNKNDWPSYASFYRLTKTTI